MSCTLDLYHIVCQLYLNKTGKNIQKKKTTYQIKMMVITTNFKSAFKILLKYSALDSL